MHIRPYLISIELQLILLPEKYVYGFRVASKSI